jgi:type IV pilus assembly protein PilQ
MGTGGTHALVFLLCMGLSTAAGAQSDIPSPGSLNTVERVRHAVLSGGRTLVQISFAREISERPPVVAMHAPQASITLDFADSASNLPKEPIEINQGELRNVQVLPSRNRVRVVLNLNRPVPHEIELSGREALVTLHRPVAGPAR